mmetsp:Transcript_36001/g.58079  ORF Transcript_36001/g.58079 Transcript_36001/m.58079 type:complete len:251 (+) Transcript_36001:289-1041(+)
MSLTSAAAFFASSACLDAAATFASAAFLASSAAFLTSSICLDIPAIFSSAAFEASSAAFLASPACLDASPIFAVASSATFLASSALLDASAIIVSAAFLDSSANFLASSAFLNSSPKLFASFWAMVKSPLNCVASFVLSASAFSMRRCSPWRFWFSELDLPSSSDSCFSLASTLLNSAVRSLCRFAAAALSCSRRVFSRAICFSLSAATSNFCVSCTSTVFALDRSCSAPRTLSSLAFSFADVDFSASLS